MSCRRRCFSLVGSCYATVVLNTVACTHLLHVHHIMLLLFYKKKFIVDSNSAERGSRVYGPGLKGLGSFWEGFCNRLQSLSCGPCGNGWDWNCKTHSGKAEYKDMKMQVPGDIPILPAHKQPDIGIFLIYPLKMRHYRWCQREPDLAGSRPGSRLLLLLRMTIAIQFWVLSAPGITHCYLRSDHIAAGQRGYFGERDCQVPLSLMQGGSCGCMLVKLSYVPLALTSSLLLLYQRGNCW